MSKGGERKENMRMDNFSQTIVPNITISGHKRYLGKS